MVHLKICLFFVRISAIDNNYNAMAAVNQTQNILEPMWEDFKADLDAVRNAITSSCTLCGTCCTSPAGFPSQADLQISADYRDVNVVCICRKDFTEHKYKRLESISVQLLLHKAVNNVYFLVLE